MTKHLNILFHGELFVFLSNSLGDFSPQRSCGEKSPKHHFASLQPEGLGEKSSMI